MKQSLTATSDEIDVNIDVNDDDFTRGPLDVNATHHGEAKPA
jgi:hypothetical protein